MASQTKKLVPSDPDKVMVIRKVTPDIVTFSTPFLRFGRIKLGGRATVVRLQTGNLAVFSPVALTDTVKKETETLGTVKYLVAPDQEHHIFLEAWHKAYPEAKIIGPESLPNYRDQQKYFQLPKDSWLLLQKRGGDSNATTSTSRDAHLSAGTLTISEEFDSDFDTEYVSSHANKELVFNHRPSRTLIEADLIFNLPATEQMSKSGESATSGIFSRMFASMAHTRGDAIWQKRFLWYIASSSDRPSFNDSMRKIQAWNFDRIIPCHGDVIETGGKGIFEKIMEWHLRK